MAIIFDPNTGAYVDNVTNKVFLDPAGTRQATDPSLVSQTQGNLQRANQLFASFGRDHARFAQTFGQEGQTVRELDRTIRGETPSVAGAQLQRGAEAGRRAAESMASGANGTSAPLARYAAIQEGGQQIANANAASAQVRAQEVADAEKTKAAIQQGMANQANAASGLALTGATAAGQTGASTGKTQAEIDEQQKEMWMRFYANLGSGAGNALAYAGAA